MTSKVIHLSARMEAIVKMVSSGNRICDVGCDHGYVSIALVERNISPSALAMDINEGPLNCAEENISGRGLHNKISTRLSNGLKEYKEGEADSLIIAGMGGPLIQDILSYNKRVSHSFKELILSPQSEIKEFREYIFAEGYTITDEDMVLDDGKFYVIMKCVPMDEVGTYNIMSTTYGPILLEKKHPILLQYLKKELTKKEKILCQLKRQGKSCDIENRIKEVLSEIKLIEDALVYMGVE